MYAREIEKSLKLWASSENQKPLLLNGARQVGKTFILKKFCEENFKNCHIFNFEIEHSLHSIFEEGLDPKQIVNALSLERGVPIDLDSDVVFFDEIQSCSAALHSLKYFCEELPQLAICAAGSLLGVAVSESPFPVGKIDELHLYPLSYYEFLLALGETLLAEYLLNTDVATPFLQSVHEKLWDYWKLYLVVGGLPEIVAEYESARENQLVALTNVRQKQKILISEYLQDMSKHSGKANSLHLERVFRSIPSQLARAQDDSVKRFRFSGVVPGISQYSRFASAFDWLEGAGLVYKVPITASGKIPLTQSLKESIFKLYLFDVGLMTALGDIPPLVLLKFEFGTYKGYIAENFVIQALHAAGYNSFFGWNEGTSEVEFLTTDLEGVVPIEVKSGRVTQAKSLSVFVRRYKPNRAYIFGGTTPREDALDQTVVLRRPIYTTGIGELGRVL